MKSNIANALSDPLLSQAEVCAVLGISRKTLQRLRKERRISFARLGHRTIRIRQSQLESLIRESQL